MKENQMVEGRKRCNGKVFLVGAGPGDPLLLTLKGADLLREAEVVVYDRLVPKETLRHVRDEARLVYVGKDPQGHAPFQEAINELLYREASAGKKVVRLKGGDPFLFGRGGEEMEYLNEKGIPVEMVPGVTSALAAPAYAGIPVTHRGLSRSVALVTGHTRSGDWEKVDWEGIARSCDTIVVLMGRDNLGNIVARLLAGGLPPETPAAAVQWGTTGSQRTVVSSLRLLEQVVSERGITAPMVLIVGRVVSMREELAWWEKRPLFGKGILLLRAMGQEVSLSRQLIRMGAQVFHAPAIRIRRNHDSATARVLERLSKYHWIAFTSPNAVDYLFLALEERGMDSRSFNGTRLIALGPGTEKALKGFGLRADLVPLSHSTRGLTDALGERDLRGERCLLVRSNLATSELRRFLEGRGASVEEVHPYRVEIAEESDQELLRNLRDGRIDVILLTSPSTVRGLLRLVDGDKEALRRSAVGCIGTVTAEEAASLGLEVNFTAEDHSEEGLLMALIRFLGVGRGG